MTDRILAALFVITVWWVSTCVVLGVVWLGRSSFRASFIVFTALAAGGLYGLSWSSGRGDVPGAYVAFVAAVAVWAWHELVFLTGWVTGPRKAPCPEGALGWRRFVFATAVVIHHELALVVTLGGIVALTWKGVNQVGTWTFLVLWGMRISAKFNVYLGVRNLSEQFIPDHLRYMLSYFRRARFNALMPLSLLVSGAVVARLVSASLAVDATEFERVGCSLVAAILGLAWIEHVFLALPLPDAVLWRWAIRGKTGVGGAALPALGVEVP